MRAQAPPALSSVTLQSDQWLLKGDFVAAAGAGRRPAVLLLNKAAGDRTAYQSLANELARRGVHSLRLDLRGHGESVNAGRFTPGQTGAEELLSGSDRDVLAALAWLRSRREVDRSRLAVVGASYSGEAMAQAARGSGAYAKAYVALSPGSFSEDSARAADASGARWLMIVGERERSSAVRAAAELFRQTARKGEVWTLDADAHATDLLVARAELPARLAEWIAAALG